MYKIIVTGCAGFIGSHLTEALLSKGHIVTGIDNFDPFYDPQIKKSNISGFISHPSFTFFENDLTNEETTNNIFSKGADIVVHLAGKAGVRPSIQDPQSYIENNITSTRVVLSAMEKYQIKKLAFASSSSVYGNNPKTPWHEKLNVDNPISPYAFSKKACELLNHTWHHLYGTDIINMRFFTVYGPRQRPDLAIHKFTRMMLEGTPLTLFGDGSTSRDYTFISDTVAGICGAVDCLMANNKVFETVNLGNNHPVSLKNLVTKISEATATEPTIKRLPMQPGDVDVTFADISKAQKLLGYHPRVKLEDGLKAFVEWFKLVNRE
ncbi:GDP-mannose 4,6-dehydratase [Marinilabilia salmonicolor]|jgi:nucleoside-diphosphate-sugar epimerase|uniref:Nucleoside-diphosphate-sugar epimerase n=1 Tax=Marinilabilia salmonicolor TaxID=989 RepID=A0A2T0XLM2_9BACT|nr:GDP-mannose 4,6-dehydratase [Marinilabilia salmonicolor]PRY99833.1 nucleoside-diphosphate-sugar epimerase [Marinilabilia salmonicolor]RCW37370.1 nucleoside-diphosphate-sugar epimerase [Marinilabilia salmonicolor]